MVSRYLMACIALVLFAGCASADGHQPVEAEEGEASIRMVLNPAPGELYSLALSGDGRVVAGTELGPGGVLPFVWTAQEGRQDLPTPEGWRFVRIDGISRDGSRVAGYGELPGKRPSVRRRESNALLRRWGHGTTALGHLGENLEIHQTEALAISGDGTVVAGVSKAENERCGRSSGPRRPGCAISTRTCRTTATGGAERRRDRGCREADVPGVPLV